MLMDSVALGSTCLGCKRYFLLNQKLPLESMTIEFKNYSFPIKQAYLKQTLLKTIVGFMNSKGGTIFMGVDDSTGQVEGVTLGRKQMDEFRLMIKQMLEKVQPAVDLTKSEQVSVDFIPVLQSKERYFYGKYIIKFIILQGDPSKLYCISERVLTSGNKHDEVQVISSFRRHNLGGVQQIKGIKVIHEIYEKARNPYKVANTFHQGCNPQPISPMILERTKQVKNQKNIVEEDRGQNMVNENSDSSSHLSQGSQKGTIIDKIKDIEIEPRMNNTLKIKPEDTHNLYIQNVRVQMVKSFINFLRNSTSAKSKCKQIVTYDQIVILKFNSRTQKEVFIGQIQKPNMKKLIDGFGINQKVCILSSPTQGKYRLISQKMYNNDTTFKLQEKLGAISKTQDKLGGGYVLSLKNCSDKYQESLQNYLQKCMNSNILRKMKRTKSGVQLKFQSESEMNFFHQLCIKPPHSKQLSQYGHKGNLIIKIEAQTQSLPPDSQKPQAIKKVKEKAKEIIDLTKFPSLMYQQVLKTQIQDQVVDDQKHMDSLELIASSLEPNQVGKLTNYMTNNMFYNIQKKISASKDRFYIRISFTHFNDSRKFLQLCLQQTHRHMLPQFGVTKTFRIGVPGNNILIFPYTQTLKQELKRLILNIFGAGVVKKSSVKVVGQNKKAWSLNLVDNSRLLEYYQKLQAYFRKQVFFFNQQWVKFKVFLDYKYLSE